MMRDAILHAHAGSLQEAVRSQRKSRSPSWVLSSPLGLPVGRMRAREVIHSGFSERGGTWGRRVVDWTGLLRKQGEGYVTFDARAGFFFVAAGASFGVMPPPLGFLGGCSGTCGVTSLRGFPSSPFHCFVCYLKGICRAAGTAVCTGAK